MFTDSKALDDYLFDKLDPVGLERRNLLDEFCESRTLKS